MAAAAAAARPVAEITASDEHPTGRQRSTTVRESRGDGCWVKIEGVSGQIHCLRRVSTNPNFQEISKTFNKVPAGFLH